MIMTNSNWQLKVVENAGELRGSIDATDVAVPTKALITDIKAQLMFIPKNFTWTVGWRAYVWQEEETGRFKELTESEWNTLLSEGTVHYSRDGGSSDSGSGTTTESEGSTAK